MKLHNLEHLFSLNEEIDRRLPHLDRIDMGFG